MASLYFLLLLEIKKTTMKKITTLMLILYCFGMDAQTPLTNATFAQAITDILAQDSNGDYNLAPYGKIQDWDVSQVTDMTNAFYQKTSFNGDISSWDVSNVTDMESIFNEAHAFNQEISAWDVSSVTHMRRMFRKANAFTGDISSWDVSNVITMGSMFQFNSSFNGDISSWDVINVGAMARMFENATAFNQDISNWCITAYTLEPPDFSTNSPLSESNKPVWNCSSPINTTWKGTTNEDWDTASNWSTDLVPTANQNITIPSGLSNYPTAATAVTFNKLTLKNGATFIPKHSGEDTPLEIVYSYSIDNPTKIHQISDGVYDNPDNGIKCKEDDTYVVIDLNGSAITGNISSGTSVKIHVSKKNTNQKQLRIVQLSSSNADLGGGTNEFIIDQSDLNQTVTLYTMEYILDADTEFLQIELINRVGGSFTISEITTSTVTGDITYKRNLPNTDWYLISPPVSGESIENVISNHSLATGSDSNLGLASFNNTNSTWDYQNSLSTGALYAAQGYSIKLQAAADISFIGNANTLNVNHTVSGGNSSDYYLLGNPFASYVNSTAFFTKNTAHLSEETIWLWEGTAYQTYNAVSSIEIAPVQGFFVDIDDSVSDQNIVFETSNQSHQSTDTFKKEEAIANFELSMESGDAKSATKVFYVAGKTTGFDNGYDSRIFGGATHNFTVYTELVGDKEGTKLAIQTLDKDDTSIIPVGVIANLNEEITFSLKSENLGEGVSIYLEDKLTGAFINLSETTYQATITEEAQSVGRFYIHNTASSLSTEHLNANNISIYKSSFNEITINGLTDEATFKMFSVTGKEVMQTKISLNASARVSLPSLAKGVYIVQLTTEAGTINKKIILE